MNVAEVDTEPFEIKLREQMERMSSPFYRGIVKKNTELIISNMKVISEQIMKHDVNELVDNNVSILRMALDKEFPRRILFTARNMSDYILWDNDVIYDLTIDALFKHRINLGPLGQNWLRKQIEAFRLFLYS